MLVQSAVWLAVALILLQLTVMARTLHDHFRPLRRAQRILLAGPARGRIAAILLAIVVAAVLLVAFRQDSGSRIWHVASVLATVGIPLLPTTFGRAVFRMFGSSESAVEATTAVTINTNDAVRPTDLSPSLPRVVWLIFDELDQRLTFSERPAGLRLPNFDRLQSESLWCSHAYPPAHCTEISIPGLVTGLPIIGTWPISDDDLEFATTAGGGRRQLAEQESVFSRAKALGARVAAIGWYHPYTRLWSQHTDYCSAYEDREQAFSVADSCFGAYMDQFRSLFESARYSPFGQSLVVRKAARQSEAIRREALELVASADFDFVFVHWPIPHAPYFFDADTARPTARNRGPAGYVDNLALTDAMLGELCDRMSASTIGRCSTLIVSSDHWFRASASYDGRTDHRVPFLVRLPGDALETCWPQEFATVRTAELVRRLLTGEVRSVDELKTWMASALAQ